MMKTERPIVKLKPSALDKALDLTSLAIILFIWIYTGIQFAKLPQTIPTHFDFNGNIDDYGNKATLFLLPSIITLVYVGMSILNRYPHKFNYMQKITAENAEQQYSTATRLMRIIKLIISILALVIMLDIVRSSTAQKSTMQGWFIPVILASIFLPVLIALTVLKPKKK
jgi:uncharacterized membrane protein